MVCGQSFGMGRRRHHCRSCGDSVCSACSNSKLVLPHIDPIKPQRVCDPCAASEDPTNSSNSNHKSLVSGGGNRSVTSMSFGAGGGGSVTGHGMKRFTNTNSTSLSMSLNSTNSFPNSPMAGLSGTINSMDRVTSTSFGSSLLSVALGRKTESVVIDEVNSDIFLDILAERCPEFAAMRNGYQTQALISSVLHPVIYIFIFIFIYACIYILIQ
jgi:hypothetical protein